MIYITRICTQCNRELPLDQFPKHKTGKYGRAAYCRDCRNKYYREHYIRGKTFVDEHKTHCAKCGCVETYVLTFHHIDYKTKSFEISGSHRKLSDLEREIKKCICLCHNCHHTYHYFYGGKPAEPEETLNDFLQPDWQPSETLRNQITT